MVKAKRKTWEKFCQSVEGIPETVRLYRILAKNPGAVLKLSVSQTIVTGKQCLEHLLEVRFPGFHRETEDHFTKEINPSSQQIVGPLTRTLSACVVLDYTPSAWRLAKVVFISKTAGTRCQGFQTNQPYVLRADAEDVREASGCVTSSTRGSMLQHKNIWFTNGSRIGTGTIYSRQNEVEESIPLVQVESLAIMKCA